MYSTAWIEVVKCIYGFPEVYYTASERKQLNVYIFILSLK